MARGKEEAWAILYAQPESTIAIGTKNVGSANELRSASSTEHNCGREGRRIRYPASEKLEIIRIVGQSHLPAKRTVNQLGISR